MKKKALKKSITIDDLAIMVAKGFENTATKNDITRLENRLDDIDSRLGKIENNHNRRIENLEDKVRIFSTIFEKNLKIKLPK